MKTTAKRPPTCLKQPGRDYWRLIQSTFELQPTDEPILLSLCATVDRLHEVRVAIAKQGVSVTDRYGQTVPNRLLQIENTLALGACKCWRELGLSSAEQTSPAMIPYGRNYK